MTLIRLDLLPLAHSDGFLCVALVQRSFPLLGLHHLPALRQNQAHALENVLAWRNPSH